MRDFEPNRLIKNGCVLREDEPAQYFCDCGKPLKIWKVPYGHSALPIFWIKNGCGKHQGKYQFVVGIVKLPERKKLRTEEENRHIKTLTDSSDLV